MTFLDGAPWQGNIFLDWLATGRRGRRPRGRARDR